MSSPPSRDAVRVRNGHTNRQTTRSLGTRNSSALSRCLRGMFVLGTAGTLARDHSHELHNRDKARRKVARVHARITDRRTDFLHKLSTRLIRENQAIAIEDLTVRNMVANHALARSISDASWRQLRTMLEYKADWYGRDLLVVDRWYPSTRVCSNCGALHDKLPLNIREWTCPCGSTHDRDVNAARNILAAGLAER